MQSVYRVAQSGRELLKVAQEVEDTDWLAKLRGMGAPAQADVTLPLYFNANIDAIKNALRGVGPDVSYTSAIAAGMSGMGASMVANISSAHIPAFCLSSRNGDGRPYKNGYDLRKYYVGTEAPDGAKKLREVVDAALPINGSNTPADIYFGAMELNGTGVYFYGDFCLALKAIPDETVILSSNSYDLVRAPLKNAVENESDESLWPYNRAREALRMSGKWGVSRDTIAAIKVFAVLGVRSRRLTTGQISDALRVDEDYIEILKVGSFATQDLTEARVTAADAAHEASIEDRRRSGPTPPAECLIWRDRRRVAERELRACGVPVYVVTSSGRVKG